MLGSAQDEILSAVAESITWASDLETYGIQDYWASPQETWDRKVGDCEDFSLLALYLLRRDAGIEDLVLVIGYGDATHAWIQIDGVDYEPRTGRSGQMKNYRVRREYMNYDSAMMRVGDR